jgi:hypothetical protein
MLFFFKPKIIHIDCFTTESYVYTLSPIEYSTKFYPEWWKALPKTFSYHIPDTPNDVSISAGTMKSCEGFINFFQNSLTIPLWTDMFIKVDDKKRIYDVIFSDGITKSGAHPIGQMGRLIDPEETGHIKIDSPWIFRCKEDVQWAWVQHTWNFTPVDLINIPPAIIDYKYQNGTNINLFISMKKKEYYIEHGQPMVNIFPLSERKLKFHNHLIDINEKRKIDPTMPIKFLRKYSNVKKILKENENKKKCPFGF